MRLTLGLCPLEAGQADNFGNCVNSYPGGNIASFLALPHPALSPLPFTGEDRSPLSLQEHQPTTKTTKRRSGIQERNSGCQVLTPFRQGFTPVFHSNYNRAPKTARPSDRIVAQLPMAKASANAD